MNGVLAKPFTKEGMLKSIKTHLVHLLKNPPPQPEHPGHGYLIGGMPYMGPGGQLNASGTPIKMEGSVTPSGNGGSTWSPNMRSNDVDGGYGMVNGNQYGMAQSGGPRQGFPGGIDGPGGRVTDTDSPPGKRQRLNPNTGTY